jgi:hypothetical protein
MICILFVLSLESTVALDLVYLVTVIDAQPGSQ